MLEPLLETEIAGIKLKNPVLTSSGTFGFGLEFSELLDLDDIGAIVVKGTTMVPRAGNPGVRIAETPAGMLNSVGLENPGADEFLTDILPKLQRFKVPVIVNMSAGSVEEYGELAAKLSVAGVSALEVNISCPNVRDGGIVFGTQPHSACAVTEMVKSNTNLPVIVKLSPNVTDITEMARAVEAGGADAISLINTLLGMAIDIKTWRPVLGNVTGGLSGPAIRPVALRMVWQVSQAVKVPLIGMGGIMCAADAVAFFLAGASAVSVGTANFVNPRAAVDIVAGLRSYLQGHGLDNISQLVGKLKL